ncbi:ArsR family transcriptional regulator [Sphaerotilus sp.]|uniref:VpaChn25_0724 family phage protein n=1 Tax=Sphaerotilus sp. TaxID=2093942 RepID=UPI00286DEF4A|nr:ArsR family transcriptional regulator [Sphaerotilus sp.]
MTGPAMDFELFQTQDRRLVLLRALENADGYQANSILLGRYCTAVGHRVSADRMAQDIAWLREQSLVMVRDLEGLSVVTLTDRGLDVALGNTRVPGVARPQPGF